MSGRAIKVILIAIILVAACLCAAKLIKPTTGTPPTATDGIMPPDTGRDTGNNPVTSQTDNETQPPETAFDFSGVPISDPAQVFVFDLDGSAMLWEHGTDRVIVPASITKLLTALTALDMMPEDTVITPRDELELVAEGSSIAYIKSNHRLTLAMLVEGMLLPSGNDAAYVTAAGAARYETGNPDMSGSDAVKYFMKKVNEYAAKIGCTGTNFTVPDGFAYEGHYTTAHDLVIIAAKAIENPVISRCTALPSDNVRYASGHTNTWRNTNRLIDPESPYYRASVTGLKTGSLTDSYSLLVSAEINGKTYIIGIFSARTSNERYVIADSIIDRLTE